MPRFIFLTLTRVEGSLRHLWFPGINFCWPTLLQQERYISEAGLWKLMPNHTRKPYYHTTNGFDMLWFCLFWFKKQTLNIVIFWLLAATSDAHPSLSGSLTPTDAALPKEWSHKSDHVFGISASLYDKNLVTKVQNGDPIADCFGIIARQHSAILAVADGVNWGEYRL